MNAEVTAYIGIGSNLDEPEARVIAAFSHLDELPQVRVTAKSSLYRSPPMGPPDQPHYVNAVARLSTRLDARELLEALHDIEREQRRERALRWGPRTLDLDLLVYGDRTSDDPRLLLPHPGVSRRAFVLVPLTEIAPDLLVPGQGRADELHDAMDKEDLMSVTLIEQADGPAEGGG